LQSKLTKAIEELTKRGYDVYVNDVDSLIHFRLSIENMNQKFYDKINRDLESIGWDKSWGATGNGE